MIKDNQRHFNRLHVVVDGLVIIISYLAAWFLVFKVQGAITGLTFRQYAEMLWLVVPVYLVLYMAFNLYTAKRVQGRRLELGRIIQANSIGLLIFLGAMYLVRGNFTEFTNNFSRAMLIYFYVFNIALEGIVRNIIRMVLTSLRQRGFNLKHIILVGYSRAAEEFIDRLKANPEWGYEVLGLLDDTVEPGVKYRGIEVVGRTDELSELLEIHHLDEIAITLGLSEYSKLEHIVAVCEKSGVHTKFIPDYNNIIPTKPYTEDLLGLPVVNIRHVPLTNTFNAMVKRCMDIVGALVAIVVFSPFMLVAAVAIKLTSPGPLIYKQKGAGSLDGSG